MDPAHQRGLASERFVERHFVGKGWGVYQRRWRTPFAEIDLCLLKTINGKTRWLLLEVKTIGDRGFDFLETRISSRQRRRLLSAQEWLESQVVGEVGIGAVFVYMGGAGEVHGFQVTLLD